MLGGGSSPFAGDQSPNRAAGLIIGHLHDGELVTAQEKIRELEAKVNELIALNAATPTRVVRQSSDRPRRSPNGDEASDQLEQKSPSRRASFSGASAAEVNDSVNTEVDRLHQRQPLDQKLVLGGRSLDSPRRLGRDPPSATSPALVRRNTSKELVSRQESADNLSNPENHELMHTIKTNFTSSREPEYPGTGVLREEVGDDDVPWSIYKPRYRPQDYTTENVLNNSKRSDCNPGESGNQGKWADPQDLNGWVSEEVEARLLRSVEKVDLELDGRPKNPIGRTGVSGRGDLAFWGPNFAADLLVTREHGNNGIQVLTKRHAVATGKQALLGSTLRQGRHFPSRFCNACQTYPCTHSVFPERELDSLTRVLITEELRRDVKKELIQMDQSSCEIYFKEDKEFWKVEFLYWKRLHAGYCDDPRATDNAWVESTFLHLHLDNTFLEQLRSKGSSDAVIQSMKDAIDAAKLSDGYRWVSIDVSLCRWDLNPTSAPASLY
jgi:ADP-ribose pyrophosphatase